MNLLPDEMLAVSGPMLEPGGKANGIIVAYQDDLNAPCKRLFAAHEKLSKAAQPIKAERIKAIIAAQARLDVRHDAIIRGVHGLFESLAELIGGEDGASLIALRHYLMPDGLSSQNKTYGGQAGQAAQLAIRMTADIRQRTDKISVGEGAKAKPLTFYIDEWISLGQKLNTYEAERGTLENEPSEGADLHNARLQWVRAMNAMVSNAEMAGLGPSEMALVFGGLQSAERKADERAREAKQKAAEGKTDEAETSAPDGKPDAG